MSRITFTITIDHQNHKTSFKDSRARNPVSIVYSTEPASVAGIYRDTAAYFLEMAHEVEHCREFAPQPCTNADRARQAQIMLIEHRNIFEEARA